MANEFIVRKGLIVTDNIKLLDSTGNNVIEIDDNGNNSSIFFNRHEGDDALSFQWQTNKRLLFASKDNQSGDGILYAYGDVGATSNSSDGGQIFTSPLSYVNQDSLLGSYEFRTFGTSGTRASVKGVATENQGASNKGTKLEFHVTEKGNNSLSKILTLNFETGSIFEGNISASGDITATTVSASYVYFPNNDFVINSLDSTFNLDFDFPSGGNKRANFNLSSGNDVVNVSQVNTSNTTGGHLIITTDGYQVVEGNSYGTLSFGDVSYNLAQIKGTSIQDATNNNRGTSLDFYTTPSGSQTAVKTATFNTSSQFIETGSQGYPSLIVGDPTLVGGIGGNALGFWVSESSDSIYHSNIAVHSVGEGWQDILSFTRDEGTTIGGVTSNFQFPNLVTIGSIDKGIKLKATGSTGDAEDLFFNSAGGSGQMKLLIGTRDADNDRYQIELIDNGDIVIQGSLTTAENVVARTLKRSGSTTDEILLTTSSLEFFGNPIFHGDVNVYSGSAFLDEYDHQFFISNATGQGTGFITLGGTGIETKIQGTGINLQAALTASAISASGDITITINGGTF